MEFLRNIGLGLAMKMKNQPKLLICPNELKSAQQRTNHLTIQTESNRESQQTSIFFKFLN